MDLIDEAKAMGLGLRAAIHTGEVELGAGDVRGIAVHLASRVLALAGDGEVLVSSSTHELLAASSLEFDDRGEHELKGISGRRRVYGLRRTP
jgi:class 3 adenylate cyclase